MKLAAKNIPQPGSSLASVPAISTLSQRKHVFIFAKLGKSIQEIILRIPPT
jgi:hypothetical protein